MELVAGTKFWSLRLDFAAKMASSRDATSPCDLLQGLVVGTSPIVCADLKRVGVDRAFHSTEMTVNEMCSVAKQARFTVNVTFISHLAMFFRNYFSSMWQKFSGLASTF